MLQERIADVDKFVEPDRVRREVYTDPQIFELEMQRIHETVWIYCGHESQVPKAGDYYTVQIGRQPMLMVRSLPSWWKVQAWYEQRKNSPALPWRSPTIMLPRCGQRL